MALPREIPTGARIVVRVIEGVTRRTGAPSSVITWGTWNRGTAIRSTWCVTPPPMARARRSAYESRRTPSPG